MKYKRRLKELLSPFGIGKYCTDSYGAYERNLPPKQHEISKRNTQKCFRTGEGLAQALLKDLEAITPRSKGLRVLPHWETD